MNIFSIVKIIIEENIDDVHNFNETFRQFVWKGPN